MKALCIAAVLLLPLALAAQQPERRALSGDRVRDDDTFHDREGREGRWSDDGRRVRITGSGGGIEAHADVRIAIPAGQRAVGRSTCRTSRSAPRGSRRIISRARSETGRGG